MWVKTVLIRDEGGYVMRKVFFICFAFGAAAIWVSGLVGCSGFKAYDTSLTRLDYSAKQIPASIQVSDPKLYKREDLINERQEEMDYLKTLLSNSRTVTFSPELVRDIESVSALSAQLGISFDAGAKLQFKQAAQLSDLEQQIAVTQLQTQLLQVQHDLQSVKASLANQTIPTPTPASTTGSSTSSTTLPAVPPPGLSDANTIATQLGTLVSSLTSRLDAASTAPRGGTAAASSPLDQFQDRQAYRRVIQSAINDTALDDLHDYNGNSLFRMQFRATVLPVGGDPDKSADFDKSLGVLRMEIKGPEFKNDKVGRKSLEDLYKEWLDHVNFRLNEVIDQETIRADPTLLELGAEGRLFSIVPFTIPKNAHDKSCPLGVYTANDLPPKSCYVIRVAIPPPPETNELDRTLEITGRYGQSAKTVLQKGIRDLAMIQLRKGKCPSETKEGKCPCETACYSAALKIAEDIVSEKASLSPLQNGLVSVSSRLNMLPGSVVERVVIATGPFFISMAERFLQKYVEFFPDPDVSLLIREPLRDSAPPPEFVAALFEGEGKNPKGEVATVDSLDFHEEEFGNKYTIKQLCDALKKSKIPDKHEKCDTLKDLNQLLRDADLYKKITAVSDRQPSEDLTNLYNLSLLSKIS
jgi:hypothetical protein